MSVVVALKKDGVVYMGADSQASKGGALVLLTNPNNYKVWPVPDVDGCLMGGVGATRASNIIKVADNLIPEIVDIKDAVDFRFVVKRFVPRLMEELDEYHVLLKENDDVPDMSASFLLAYHDRLFSIDRYGCVIEVDDFCAIGSGAGEAYGSLVSTDNEDDPIERIKKAIRASASRDIYVDYPIVISDTDSCEYNVVYEKDI